MKKLLLLGLIALLALTGPVSAQTLIQQSPTMLSACNQIANAGATIAVATAQTVTITPPAGQYVYLCGLDYSICQNATGAAISNATITTTGLPGNPKYQYSLVATVDACTTTQAYYFGLPLKSNAAGTAVTIVAASQTQASATINAYYFTAP